MGPFHRAATALQRHRSHGSLRQRLDFIGFRFLILVLGGTIASTLAGCALFNAGPGPTLSISIAATPASVVVGSSTSLSVVAANATGVTVTGSDGSSFMLAETGGTQAVKPSSSTTYTATATGWKGSTATSTASVTVNQVPTVTISASPSTILADFSSTLTVAATSSTSVVITGSDGSSATLPVAGGTDVVNPQTTTTYTVTAIGLGGKTTASTTLNVLPNPAPTVSISAYPTSIAPGDSSILTIAAAQATQVVVTGSDGSSTTLSATGGTDAVSPTTTTVYTVAATGTGGTTKATIKLNVVTNPPPAVTISAEPASIGQGGSSTLTISSTYATDVTVTGSDGSRYTLTSGSGGLLSVTPSATTTYTANATGPGGNSTANATVTVTSTPEPAVSVTANPSTVVTGNSSTLTIMAHNATAISIAGSDGSNYTLAETNGGTQIVSPAATTTYTVTASGVAGATPATAATTVTVNPTGSVTQIDHVIFMLQENHSFDNYFGMLNPYRVKHGWNVGDDGNTYTVDGIDDKLGKIKLPDDEGASYSLFKFKSTCVDDNTSDWLSSYGDANRYNFTTTRPILMNGFVHIAEGFAKSCAASHACSVAFTDLTGKRAMGYYDEGFLNYYYYMASQFAVSDRWFSPVASKSIDNRIATFTGGTTQGLVRDPGLDDHLSSQLIIPTIFQELDQANVSWKIYYTVTQGYCLSDDECGKGLSRYPATDFSNLSYSYQYLYGNASGGACIAPTQPSSVVGDTTNSFCIDPDKIAPISSYYTDLANGTLPSFAFIEAGYGNNDEHGGSGQSILLGQAAVAKIVNSLMGSSSWSDSVFFFAYDEGGGPYDHVPPVPGHSNDFTDASLGAIPDISSIAVNPDGYNPCVSASGTPTTHCDLHSSYPGTSPDDAPAVNGFAAQLGFRLPNTIISPFTRRHYVSHTPVDHTAVIKFVESRFIGNAAHLTARDAVQPSLLEFFDFDNIPWATPPTPPAPVTAESLGYNSCTPKSM